MEQHRERQPDPRRPGAAPDAHRAAEPAVSSSGVTTAPLRTAPSVVEAKPGAPAPAAAPRRRCAARVRATATTTKSAAEGVQGAVLRAGAARCVRVAPVAPPPETVAMAAPAPAPAPAPKPEHRRRRTAERQRRRRRRRQARLGMAGEGQGRRHVLRDREPEGHRHRRQRGPAGGRERRGHRRLRRHGLARLRQAHHRQAQQDLPVGVRAQPRHPGEGRREGRPRARRSRRWATPTRPK